MVYPTKTWLSITRFDQIKNSPITLYLLKRHISILYVAIVGIFSLSPSLVICVNQTNLQGPSITAPPPFLFHHSKPTVSAAIAMHESPSYNQRCVTSDSSVRSTGRVCPGEGVNTRLGTALFTGSQLREGGAHPGIPWYTWVGWQTGRQTGRHACRQTDRQTD